MQSIRQIYYTVLYAIYCFRFTYISMKAYLKVIQLEDIVLFLIHSGLLRELFDDSLVCLRLHGMETTSCVVESVPKNESFVG